MEGNYNLEYGIAVNVDGVHLTGIPNATILVQNENWKDNPYSDGRRHVIDTKSDIDNLKVTISNLHVKGANILGSNGFDCRGSSTVNNCTSENSGGYGFSCRGTSIINNCTSKNSSDHGFHCWDTSIINNCTSKNSSDRGFSCWKESIINNCTSKNSSDHGFYCGGSSTVNNCTSENSGGYGFSCTSTFEGVFSFNILKGDKMNDRSSAPAVVEYNIIQEG